MPTSVQGQEAEKLNASICFRFTPESGLKADIARSLKVPNSQLGSDHSQSSGNPLNFGISEFYLTAE
jgi:hypothetical protein